MANINISVQISDILSTVALTLCDACDKNKIETM